MSPSAQSASASEPAVAQAAERLLADGEVIVLALKPSGWFVLLASLPVLLLALAAAAGAFVAGARLEGRLIERVIFLACAAAGVLRLLAAMMQWHGRLYVLTNRRVIRLAGVLREDLYHCPLRLVRQVFLTATAGERLAGAGSLVFETDGEGPPGTTWACIPRPTEVRRIVEETIRASR